MVCTSGRSRFDITFKDVVGESNAVTPEMTISWYETSLPNYPSTTSVIFIMRMNLGYFYQGLPKKTMHTMGKSPQEGNTAR